MRRWISLSNPSVENVAKASSIKTGDMKQIGKIPYIVG